MAILVAVRTVFRAVFDADDTAPVAVRAALLELPAVFRPKVVLCGRRQIPRTHTGKIQRRKLSGWFARFEACGAGPLVQPLVES